MRTVSLPATAKRKNIISNSSSEMRVALVVGGVEQQRHDVFARIATFLVGELGGVGVHVGQAVARARVGHEAVGARLDGAPDVDRDVAAIGEAPSGIERVGDGVVGVLVADDAVRPVVHEPAVASRHTEHLGDSGERAGLRRRPSRSRSCRGRRRRRRARPPSL